MNEPIHLSKFWKVLPSGAEWTLTGRDWMALQLHRGAAYALAGDLKKELATGEAIVCPPKTALKLLASVLGGASFRGVAIRIASLTGFLTAVERRCLETEAARELAPFVALPAKHPMSERLAELSADNGGLGLSVRLAIVQSFADLVAPQLREAGAKGAFAAAGELDARSRLMQLINQMPESELAALSLGQFAKRIHSCERHASRLFQEIWGESFRTFASKLRLKKACQLLLEGKLKIIDVALESGHGSLAHFNYVFKKQMHLTPTEWRERRLKSGAGAARSSGATTQKIGGSAGKNIPLKPVASARTPARGVSLVPA